MAFSRGEMSEIAPTMPTPHVTIHLVTYNPARPGMYTALAARIGGALAARALTLAHVGSTSVPGLSAKPVIDMVLVVSDSTDEDSYVPALEPAGCVLRIRAPRWFEHRMLRTPESDGNLHVFSRDHEEVGRMSAFRN